MFGLGRTPDNEPGYAIDRTDLYSQVSFRGISQTEVDLIMIKNGLLSTVVSLIGVDRDTKQKIYTDLVALAWEKKQQQPIVDVGKVL